MARGENEEWSRAALEREVRGGSQTYRRRRSRSTAGGGRGAALWGKLVQKVLRGDSQVGCE